MASVEPDHVSMDVKPVTGTPVPNEPSTDAGKPVEEKKGGIDVLSRKFDNFALVTGKAYGRAANASPCGCCCLGMLLLVLGALPFFYESSRGRRSNVNRGQGVAFRSDYGMWSPADSHMAYFYEKVMEEVPEHRKQ